MRKTRIHWMCLATLGALVLAGFAAKAESAPEPPPLQVVTALVGGKNVFIPSTLALPAGAPASLSIFNSTDTPHGFAIRALGVETVIPEQTEQRVELPVLSPGLYRIHCQLHEAHRSATLLVVDD